MVDIHCHILPGLDDGSDKMETSIQMAEAAIADGVTHVVGTPHANSHYKFDLERNLRLRDELQAAVGNRLTLATGCDFHLNFENLQDLEKNPQKYTINQKNYLLVEFADFSIPPSMDDTMHRLHLMGLSPIITHPERNAMLRTKPERMYRWLHQGSYVQITAQSITGRFGSSAQQRAEQWLDEDRVHFIASDAHNLTGRPLQLARGVRCGSRTPRRRSRQGAVSRKSAGCVRRPQPSLRTRARRPQCQAVPQAQTLLLFLSEKKFERTKK